MVFKNANFRSDRMEKTFRSYMILKWYFLLKFKRIKEFKNIYVKSNKKENDFM